MKKKRFHVHRRFAGGWCPQRIVFVGVCPVGFFSDLGERPAVNLCEPGAALIIPQWVRSAPFLGAAHQ